MRRLHSVGDGGQFWPAQDSKLWPFRKASSILSSHYKAVLSWLCLYKH